MDETEKEQKMRKVLAFKTASEAVMDSLLRELRQEYAVTCCIQTSLIDLYKQKYQDVSFFDIEQEGFYDLSDEVITRLQLENYDSIWIPSTGVRATNFGNIMSICKRLQYQKMIFYNCNGEKNIVKKKSVLQEKIIYLYIRMVEKIYKK